MSVSSLYWNIFEKKPVNSPCAGPDVVTNDNPRLVYARLTGSVWQALKQENGHD